MMSLFGVTIPIDAGPTALVILVVIALLTGILMPRWLVNRMLQEKDQIIQHLTERLEETKVLQPLLEKVLAALVDDPKKKDEHEHS